MNVPQPTIALPKCDRCGVAVNHIVQVSVEGKRVWQVCDTCFAVIDWPAKTFGPS